MFDNAQSPFHRPPAGGEYYVFRDPIYNLIEIDNEIEGRLVRRILGTRELQRLRFISQNGLGRFVYQGMEGTRFPHSIGAYHTARRLIHSLKQHQPSPEEGFPDALAITPNDLVTFPIASLLHDIGHGPLSHVWEHCSHYAGLSPYNHESITIQILTSIDTEIGRFLGETIKVEFPEFAYLRDDVLAMLQRSHRLYYLHPLLAGNLDIDRLDFMVRDTRNAGVTYGFHDLDWIIRSFRFARVKSETVTPRLDVINNTGTNEDDKLAVEVSASKKNSSKPTFDPFWTIAVDGRKGLNTLVQFLHGRENMYSLVYLHKTIRSATTMLVNLLKRASELAELGKLGDETAPVFKSISQKSQIPLNEVINLDDSSMWEQIKSWSKCGDQSLVYLSRGLLSRQYYKVFSVKKSTYELLKQLDGPLGDHIAALVSARVGVSLEHSRYLYAFDHVSFKSIGKEYDRVQDSVWILEEGLYGHKFTDLHTYWINSNQKSDKELYFFMVDQRVVAELSVIVERLNQTIEVNYNKEVVESLSSEYRILAPLGKEGYWKSVYLGVPSKPGDMAYGISALKVYKNSADAAAAINRDVRQINLVLQGVSEARYLARANVIAYSDKNAWLLEELWSSSILDYINQIGPLNNVFEILRLTKHLFTGLSAMHSKNFRHTDIKLENCGIIRSGRKIDRYVLGDFGCMSQEPNRPPSDERLKGTQRTRAPEVITSNIYSLGADVWGLGSTIYAAVTGTYPFMAMSTPHGTADERAQREQHIKDNMDELWSEFNHSFKDRMPPIISGLLDACFRPVEQRATAAQISAQAGAIQAALEGRPRDEKARIEHAWRSAVDILRQAKASQTAIRAVDREAVQGMKEFLPPHVLAMFQ